MLNEPHIKLQMQAVQVSIKDVIDCMLVGEAKHNDSGIGDKKKEIKASKHTPAGCDGISIPAPAKSGDLLCINRDADSVSVCIGKST
jgi:hypothetical protein